jgi:hypothetical protein
MRQRTINWSAAIRDMRNYRSPEKLLAAETLSILKDADRCLAEHGVPTANVTRRRLYDLVCKLEARHG